MSGKPSPCCTCAVLVCQEYAIVTEVSHADREAQGLVGLVEAKRTTFRTKHGSPGGQTGSGARRG